MKAILPLEELNKLIEHSGYPMVSIYLPTSRIENASQDQIRLKNILKEAESQLLEYGLRSPVARQLLEPVKKLLNDPTFWLYQDEGLAIFLSSDQVKYYRLPISFNELLVVGNRFHLKPLIPLFLNDGIIFILAISQNGVRLLQATRYFTKEVTPKTIPQNLAETLKYDQLEKQTQFHTTERAYPAIFHGQGLGKDSDKINILRFFQQVDKGLHDLLNGESAPLIIAAVDYLQPIYHQANTYKYLIDEGIKGNPEQVSDRELKELAWTIVQPYLEREQKEATALYYEAAAKGLTSDNIKQAVLSAYDGRISTLFVATGIQLWGNINIEQRRVILQKKKRPGSQDLLDFTAVHTLIKGGVVYATAPEKIPGGKLLAAIFRY